MEKLFDFESVYVWIPYLIKGLSITLIIAFTSALFGIVLGVILVIMTRSKFLRFISSTYIDIFRGTPVILQLSIIYFAVPQILDRLFNTMLGNNIDFAMNAVFAAIITFSLNSAAYVAEVIRAGINSIDKGEIEAARALGVSKFHIYKDIIFPLAFKNSLPTLMNELVTLVKESSVVSIIGVQDLMRRQQIVTSQTFMYFEPLLFIGVIYYIVIKLMTITSRQIEKRLVYDNY
ncbi:amino acid ABC transporter permease [Mycoplasmatota bacterium]|nr:amino acid ABC transporter permease [Mycoplasmatota bacterium]